jgi:hypothetical protein
MAGMSDTNDCGTAARYLSKGGYLEDEKEMGGGLK